MSITVGITPYPLQEAIDALSPPGDRRQSTAPTAGPFGGLVRVPLGDVQIASGVRLPPGVHLTADTVAGTRLTVLDGSDAIRFTGDVNGQCNWAAVTNLSIVTRGRGIVCDDPKVIVESLTLDRLALSCGGVAIDLFGCFCKTSWIGRVHNRGMGGAALRLRGNANDVMGLDTNGGGQVPDGTVMVDVLGDGNFLGGLVIENLHTSTYVPLRITGDGGNNNHVGRLWAELGQPAGAGSRAVPWRAYAGGTQVQLVNAGGTRFDSLFLHPGERLALTNSPGVTVGSLSCHGHGDETPDNCITLDKLSDVTVAACRSAKPRPKLVKDGRQSRIVA
jgi:hypothetical protein